MATIDKKLIHFNKKEEFLKRLEAKEIKDTSIVFIKSTHEIWTHGEFYSQIPEGLLTQEEAEELFYTKEEVDETFATKEELVENYDKSVTPRAGEREIVYTTVSGNAIEWDETPANVVSNIYYKDKGFGKIVVDNTKIPSFENNKDLKSLVIGEGFTGSNSSTFCSNCTSLEYVYFSDGITQLNNAFQYCTSLKKVRLPETLTYMDYTFQFCKSLEDIRLPDSVTTIWRGVFQNCEKLSKINFPPNLKDIGGWSNFFNTGFVSLYIPDTVTQIGSMVSGGFKGCKNLLHVRLSDKLTEIYQDSFNVCSSLQEIIIPKGVTKIGAAAFNNCSNLKRIVIPSSVKEIEFIQGNHGAFRGVNPLFIDSGMDTLNEFPGVSNLETLILRANKVIEDVDSYVSTFTLEEGQELPEGAIQTRTNLDQYIGTPNNWLKIYVPANLLKAYQERYPTLKNHLHPITGEDIYATKEELDVKQDRLTTGSYIKIDDNEIDCSFNPYNLPLCEHYTFLPERPAEDEENKIFLIPGRPAPNESEEAIEENRPDDNRYRKYIWTDDGWDILSYSRHDWESKQDLLTAGTGISINNNVINCTLDTTVFKVVNILPDRPDEGDENKIFIETRLPGDRPPPSENEFSLEYEIAAVAEASTDNKYSEYIWVNDEWELIGIVDSNNIDLRNYPTFNDVATTHRNGLMSASDKEKIDNELKTDYISSSNTSSITINTTYKKRLYSNITSSNVGLIIYDPSVQTSASYQWFDGQKIELYLTYRGTSPSCTVQYTTSTDSRYIQKSDSRLILKDLPAKISQGDTAKIEIVYDGTNWIVTNCNGADKLNNSVTLWGQDFDGSSNVTGSISNVGTITPSNSNVADIGSVTLPFRYLYSSRILSGNATYNNVEFGYNYHTVDSYSQMHDLTTHSFNVKTCHYCMYPPEGSNGYFRIYEPKRSDGTQKGYFFASTNKLDNGVVMAQIGVSEEGNVSHLNVMGTLTTKVWDNVPSDLNNYDLYINGNIKCVSLTGSVSSDVRLKENIDDSVDYIERLTSLGNVVEYNYTEEAIETHEGLDNKVHTGLIYQNVENSDIPNLSAQDDDGHGFVNYYSPDLIATMIGAIQQLSKKVETLENEIKELKKSN